MSRFLVFLCFGLALSVASCSRGCSTPAEPAPSASASVEKPVATHAPSAKPPTPAPAQTPKIPPQLVACQGLVFYRITDDALHVFEASKRVPPPQLRGSATASHSARLDVAEPLNVVSLGRGGVLVVGKQNVFRYQQGEKKAQPSPPIPTEPALWAWSAPDSSDSFWVHGLGSKEINRYTFPKTGTGSLDHSAEPLGDFDARLFTVLSDGVPLYSTAKGLFRAKDAANPTPLPRLAQPAKLLFADAAEHRYWTADAAGGLALHNQDQPAPPVFTARVPGTLIDTAVEGDRVAVLSMELKDQLYRPTVTIFSKGRQTGQLSIGPSGAYRGQPELDLCLVTGRSWVVVGGRHWLQLLDWSGPRLLAEW